MTSSRFWLMETIAIVHHSFLRGNVSLLVLLELSVAFNTINLRILLGHLPGMGLGGADSGNNCQCGRKVQMSKGNIGSGQSGKTGWDSGKQRSVKNLNMRKPRSCWRISPTWKWADCYLIWHQRLREKLSMKHKSGQSLYFREARGKGSKWSIQTRDTTHPWRKVTWLGIHVAAPSVQYGAPLYGNPQTGSNLAEHPNELIRLWKGVCVTKLWLVARVDLFWHNR